MEFYAKDKELRFTVPMKKHVENKLKKLEKIVDDISGSKIVISKENHLKKVEITLPGNIRSSKAGDDFYTLVIEVVDQLERQITKYKEMHYSKKRKEMKTNFNITLLDEDYSNEEYKIIEKHIPTEMMYKEDAVEKMELLGHTFFAFVDIESKNMCVVYKRFDGQYGCLILE